MQKNTVITLIFTCVAGCFGILFRWLQHMSAFEPDTGLPIEGAWQSYVVTAIIVVTAVVLFFMARVRHRPAAAFLHANSKVKSFIFTIIVWIACALIVVGSVSIFLSAEDGENPMLIRILAVLGMASGLSLPAFASGIWQRGSSPFNFFLSIIPVIFCCLWIIVSYKNNAGNPVISAFAVEILALAASTLGFFYVAGFACGIQKPRITFYFCNFAAFLCMVTLADGHTPEQLLIFAGMAIAQFLYAAGTGLGIRPK